MAATIKWEFIKTFHHLRGLLVFFIALLAVIWILPPGWFDGTGGTFNTVILALSFTAMFCVLILMFYPQYNVIHDFRMRTYALERGTGSPFRNTVAAKMIVNLAVIVLAGGLILAATILFKKFSTESVKYFTVTLNMSMPLAVLDASILSPAILLFSYIVASTGRVFREARLIGTIIIGAPLWFINLATSNPDTNDLVVEVFAAKFLVTVLLLLITVKLGERRYEQHISNT
jgi:fumarate reductase subunit D